MVSTNTQFNGVVRQKRTLIFQQFSAKYQAQSIPATTKWVFAMNLLMKRLLIISVLFLGLSFITSNVYGQCNADCSELPAIVNLGINGNTPLCPFFTACNGGGCSIFTVDPVSVDCSDIGTNSVTVTVTATRPDNSVDICTRTISVADITQPTITCPAAVTVLCENLPADTMTTNTGVATATDNCLSVSVSYSDPAPGTSNCTMVARTWTAVDGNGVMNTCVQNIIIIDNTAPVLTLTPIPNDTLIDCDKSVPPYTGTITTADNCSSSLAAPTPTVTNINKGTNPLNCNFYNYDAERKWLLVDACGNKDSVVQKITFQDTIAPVVTITSPSPTLVPAGANCLGNISVIATAADVCADSNLINIIQVVPLVTGTTVTLSGLTINQNFPAGKYEVIITSSDPCGNIGTAKQMVEIKDLVAPNPSCQSFSIPVNSYTGYTILTPNQIVVPDPISNPYTTDDCTPFNLLVFDLAIDTVFCDSIGFAVKDTLYATDANGNIGFCVSNVTVLPGPPTIGCDTIIDVNLNAAGNYNLNTADLNALGSTFIDMCSTSALSFTGTPSTFSCADIGDNYINLTGTNSFGLSSTCSALVRVHDMTPPTPTCAPFNAYLDQTGNLSLDGSWLMSGAPEIVMVSDSILTGDTRFRVTVSQNTSFSFGFTFNKAVPHFGDRFFYRIGSNPFVTLINGTMPPAPSPVSVSLMAGETFEVWLRTTDNSGGRAEVRITGIPLFNFGELYASNWSGLSSNRGKAFITGNSIFPSIDNCTPSYDLTYSASPSVLTCDSIGAPIPVIVTVADESNNMVTCTSAVTVIDTLTPQFMCEDFTANLGGNSATVEPGWFMMDPSMLFMESSDNGSLTAGYTDYILPVSTNGVLNFKWSYNSNDTTASDDRFGYLINGVFIPLNTGLSHTNVNRNITLSQGQTFGFRMMSDNDLKDATASISGINFSGAFDPVKWSRNMSNSNGRAFIHGAVTDNCTDVQDMTFEFSINSAAYVSNYSVSCADIGITYSVKLRITDGNGNRDSCTANLDIVDNEAPVAGCLPPYSTTLNGLGEHYVLNSGVTTFIKSVSYDNCTASGALTVTADPDTLTCANIGANTITFKVTDSGGNYSTCTTVITVQENTPPAITCPPAMTVSCENLPTDTIPSNSGMAIASDNCGNVTLTYSNVFNATSTGCYNIERTWKATDMSGNMKTCNQVFTIVDNEKPKIDSTFMQNDTLVDCNAIPLPIHPTYSDNCMGVKFSYDTLDMRIDTMFGVDTFLFTPADLQYYNYNIYREWRAIDACGQDSVLRQTVMVQDTTKPVLNLPDSIMFTANSMCQAMVNLTLTAADISDCTPFSNLTITNDAPVGDGMANASSPTGTGYPVGTTKVKFTITDVSSNTCVDSVYVIVEDNDSPYVNCMTNTLDVVLSSGGYASIVLADVVTSSGDNCGVDSLEITPKNFTCADLGPQTVLVEVFDGTPTGIATCTANVIVKSSNTVGGLTCPGATTVNCWELPVGPSNTGSPTYNTSGACGTNILSHVDNLTSGSYKCGVITRTFTITNGSLTNSCNQLITIQDNLAPNFLTAIPGTATVQCGLPAPLSLMAVDSCNGTFTVPSFDTIVAATYSANPLNSNHYNYNSNRTWTATDSCGNATVATQLIRVRDQNSPVLAFPNPLVIPTGLNKCDTLIDLNIADYISDACAADSVLSFKIDDVPGSIINNTFSEGTYSFKVWVDDPSVNAGPDSGFLNLVIKDMQSPDAVCVQNIAITLDNTGNANIDSTKVDAGSSDYCTPFNMLDMTVTPNTFTTADIGPVQITLTVEDQAGNINSCISNGVVVGGTLFDAADVSLPVSGTGTVPVSIANFQNVTSFAFNIDVTDVTVATATALSNINPALTANGTFNSSATINGFSVIWTATSASSPLTLTDGSVLFDLDVIGVGNAGDMSVVDITTNTVMKLIGGVSTPSGSSALDGSVTIFNPSSTYTYSVLIETEEGAPVANANVAQTGGMTATATTGAAGTASFTANSGMTATFTPDKNTGWKNGITVNDAFLVLQHPNPTSTFGSGYKNIAADANKDNIITGNDAILIFQLAVDPAFTSIPGNTSWRFIHETPNLSSTASPWGLFSEFYSTTATMNETVKFVGVKTGDVDASANPLLRPINNVSYTESFEFLLENKWVENAGERIEVPFKAKGFKGINGYQYSIDFETKQLEYVEMIPGVLPNLTSYNIKDALAANGQLTTGWLSMNAMDFDDETVLFTLVFDAKSDNFELKDAISASDNLIPMEVIESNGLLKNNVELVFQSGVSSTDDTYTTNFDLRQNVPNPFENETVIGFNLPKAGAIQMNFMDATGKLLHNVKGNFAQGYNEVSVSKQNLPATGVVLYQLQTEFGTLVKKMIILE